MQVDAALVGQAHQVHQHVGQFVADARARRFVQLAVRTRGQPLVVLCQFRHFHGQGHGQVFWRVELVPVALGGKGAQARADVEQAVGWRIHAATCSGFSMKTLNGSSG